MLIVYVAHVSSMGPRCILGAILGQGELNWVLGQKPNITNIFPRCEINNLFCVISYSFGIVTLRTFEEDRQVSRFIP